jgi:hypothetical protein
MHGETPLDTKAMAPVREAIDLLLRATEPNPTFVMNRRADVLDTNDTGDWLLRTFNANLDAFERPYNIARTSVIYPIRFRRGELALNLFTTIATMGTPVDVTMQELRIVMFFPADEQSKRVLEERR